MSKLILSACSLILTIQLAAQKEHWETYLAQYNGGAGSTIVNMSLKQTAPDKRLPFLFSAGVKYSQCNPDGFPAATEFDILYKISDSIAAQINRRMKNKFAGTFTHQCQRRDYFYVDDTSGLRVQIIVLLAKYFPGYTPVFTTRADSAWETYLTFLYPSELIMEYMKNENVVKQLQQGGDKLIQPRKVDHLLCFRTTTDRDCFIRYASRQQFIIESYDKDITKLNPYRLRISRTDKVDINSISNLTLQLEKESKKCHGIYDTWETIVVR